MVRVFEGSCKDCKGDGAKLLYEKLISIIDFLGNLTTSCYGTSPVAIICFLSLGGKQFLIKDVDFEGSIGRIREKVELIANVFILRGVLANGCQVLLIESTVAWILLRVY